MKKRSTLIFYIGNGVVKAAIVQKEKVTHPHVLAFERRELPYADMRDRDQLESRIITELNALCLDVKKNLLGRPECADIILKDAVILFSSPWYISQTKNIHVAHEKPFVVTEELMNAAIEEAAKPFLGRGTKEFTMIEKKLIKTSLNGYATTTPEKKKATIMELSVFFSFARTASIDMVRQTIEKHFHFDALPVHSQSLVSFSVIQSVWADHPNYIITDITAELTELLIVRENALAEAASFPQGKQYVLRELTRIMNTTGEVSASFLKLYEEKKLDQKLVERMETALKEIKKTWLQSFTKVLGEMSIGASLPSRFYLFGPKDAAWLFGDFIKGEEYQQFSFSEGKFEVYDVKVSDLSDYCTWHAETEKDLSIAIASIYNFHL